MNQDDKLVTAVAEFIKNVFGSTNKETEQVEVTKSLDEEKRLALFVAMSPDEVDAHGDVTSAEVIEKACHSFNTHCRQANLFHRVETDNAEIVQSFINLTDFTTDDGREIKKGAWLQWWHFPEGDEVSDKLWGLVKSGEINGISIGAKGTVENVDD